jgi:hypothetical protein
MHDVLRRPTAAPDARTPPELKSFVRNRYFYGKLLDVHHLELEQDYFNDKRRLLNRLGLGSGVLCGLKVEPFGDTGIVIRPGVAIDGFGREIVVPAPFVLEDPLALTDDCGEPTGDHAEKVAMICLDYHECDIEPTPVLVSECDVREECKPGAVRERFRILVHDGIEGFHSSVDCAKLGGAGTSIGSSASLKQLYAAGTRESFGLSREDARFIAMYGVLCEAIDHSCAPPEHSCVPIAVVIPSDDGTLDVEDCGFRVPIYSNVVLLDLILCLARRMAAAGGARSFRYEEGDTASAATGTEVATAATLLDPAGDAVADETVTFRVRAGGGVVGDGTTFADEYQATSDAGGRVTAQWQLGDGAGLNTLEATDPEGARIVFHALAETGG